MRHQIRTFLLAVLLASLLPAQRQSLPHLRVSDNRRFLVKQDGSPFFYLADTAWGIFHYDREDAELYLKNRAAKGFTVIQAVIVPFGGGLENPNFYGHTVFIDRDPTRPNEPFFQYVDWIVNRAESLGLYMALVPIWGGSYLSGKRCVVDKSQAHAYGRFLGRRYRDKPIIWVLGGDWFPDGVEDIWRAMAAGITEGDGGSHLMTYHPTGQKTSSTYFHNDAWLDFNMVQSRHIIINRTYEQIAEDYARTPVKPVIDGESVYEGITSELLPYDLGGALIQAHDVRRAAYCAVFAGAAGVAYGSHGIWDYRGSGGKKGGRPRYGAPITFQEALERPAGSQMQHLRALIESRPMLVRVPDQWLIANDPLSTTERIQACRASDGSYAFIYTSAGRPVRVRLRDKIHDKLSGTMVRAYWYDPRRGTSSLIGDFQKTEAGDTQADVLRGDVARTFTPPSSGAGNDWVLVIDDASKNFPPPGKLSNSMKAASTARLQEN